MKKNIKALLLSALILPGLGQLYKGDKVKGGIMIALVNIFLLAALFLVMQGMGEGGRRAQGEEPGGPHPAGGIFRPLGLWCRRCPVPQGERGGEAGGLELMVGMR